MSKDRGNLVKLVTYYDGLTESQAETIVKMSKIIAEQARTIALLQGDRAEEERTATGE